MYFEILDLFFFAVHHWMYWQLSPTYFDIEEMLKIHRILVLKCSHSRIRELHCVLQIEPRFLFPKKLTKNNINLIKSGTAIAQVNLLHIYQVQDTQKSATYID